MVIVGEAPGAQEVVVGLPFVGPSGRLLEQVLQEVGLGDVPRYYTNALRCKPPNGSAPTRDHLEVCRHRLLAEVAAAPRKLILALGNSALHALSGEYRSRITHVRGQVLDLPFGPVLPTLHPAAVLRSPGDYRKLKADLEYAAEIWRTGARKCPGVTQFTVCNTPELVERALAGLTACTHLAADIETTGLNPRQDTILALGICWRKNRVLIFPASVLPQLRPLFLANEPRWIWQNGKFDTAFLRRAGLPAEVHEDVMLLHYCLDETRGGHGLKELSQQFLGAEDYANKLKPWLKKQSDSFRLLPEAVLYEYLAKDADYTWQLFHLFRPKVQQDPALNALYTRILIPASGFLRTVEATGIYTDPDRIEALAVDLKRRGDAARQRMWDLIEERWQSGRMAAQTFNPASSVQVQYVIYDLLRIPPAAGMPRNTEARTLVRMSPHPFLSALLDYRRAVKLLATYVYGVRDKREADGRVYSSYLLTGTETGRLSSDRPNLQNIPRDAEVRGIFQAPPGRILIEADLSQAELRMLGHLSGDPYFLAHYQDPRFDLHSGLAAQIFGPSYTAEQRTRVKALNFGIMYGRGAKAVSDAFSIPVAEAQALISAWAERVPVAWAYLQRCRARVRNGGVLVTPFGRKRRFSLVTADMLNHLQNEASNFAIQSTVSDIVLIAGIAAQSALHALDAYIVNLVHDSLLVEAPSGSEREVARILRSYLMAVPERLLQSKIPFLVDCKAGRVWGSLREVPP